MAEWMFIFEVSKRAIFLLNNASECTSIFNQKSNNKQDKERYFLDHKPHFPSHYGASKHTKENQEIAVLLSPFLEIKFNGKFSNCSRKYQMIGSFQILWQVYWLDFRLWGWKFSNWNHTIAYIVKRQSFVRCKMNVINMMLLFQYIIQSWKMHWTRWKQGDD